MSITELGRIPLGAAGFGERLMADWVSNFERVRPFFRRDPRKPAEWDTWLATLDGQTYPRRELCEILERTAGDGIAPEAARESIRLLAQPNTYAVLTGQQPGLLGGPLYSLFKALGAIRWARLLSKRFGPARHFVPVFWVASDDHDLAEIDHAYFLDAKGLLRRLRAQIDPQQQGAPAAGVSVGEELARLRPELEELCPGGAEAWVARYREFRMGEAFARWMSQSLGPAGLVAVEARHLRPLWTAQLARELEGYRESAERVRQAGEALRQAGYEPGFKDAPPAPHLFLATSGIRARLEPVGDGSTGRFMERSRSFESRGILPQEHALAELQARAARSPQDFSASAAFRPVLQDLILPTAAAVLGPGEFSYWAQLAPLHDLYAAPWPMLIPRPSLTLVDAEGQKAMKRLELKAEDLFLPGETLRDRVLSAGPAGEVLKEGTARMMAELESLHQRVRQVDQGLDPLFAKAKERIRRELDQIAAKTRASVAQRDDARAERLERLMALFHPGGRPQERVLCSAWFLASHRTLAEELLVALEPEVFEHRVLGMG